MLTKRPKVQRVPQEIPPDILAKLYRIDSGLRRKMFLRLLDPEAVAFAMQQLLEGKNLEYLRVYQAKKLWSMGWGRQFRSFGAYLESIPLPIPPRRQEASGVRPVLVDLRVQHTGGPEGLLVMLLQRTGIRNNIHDDISWDYYMSHHPMKEPLDWMWCQLVGTDDGSGGLQQPIQMDIPFGKGKPMVSCDVVDAIFFTAQYADLFQEQPDLKIIAPDTCLKRSVAERLCIGATVGKPVLGTIVDTSTCADYHILTRAPFPD